MKPNKTPVFLDQIEFPNEKHNAESTMNPYCI